MNILNTDLDAIYATQLEGIEAFRFDVPDGTYRLTLHFAELRSDIVHEALAYNLDDENGSRTPSQERTFSVSVNDNILFNKISNQEQLVPEKAVSFKTIAEAKNGTGISVTFTDIKGEAMLNGIQLQKIR